VDEDRPGDRAGEHPSDFTDLQPPATQPAAELEIEPAKPLRFSLNNLQITLDIVYRVAES
jgi:hypothetical protein